MNFYPTVYGLVDYDFKPWYHGCFEANRAQFGNENTHNENPLSPPSF